MLWPISRLLTSRTVIEKISDSTPEVEVQINTSTDDISFKGQGQWSQKYESLACESKLWDPAQEYYLECGISFPVRHYL